MSKNKEKADKKVEVKKVDKKVSTFKKKKKVKKILLQVLHTCTQLSITQ